MKLTICITAALVLARPGVGKCEPQPEPHCTTIMRTDAGKYAECSGVTLPLPTFADCLTCASADHCVDVRAERDTAQASLEAERKDHADTEAARLACERGCVPPAVEELPGWYERPGLWAGLATAIACTVGGFATEDHPAWWLCGGFGLGAFVAELAR